MIIQWCNENQGFLSAVISIVAVLAAIGIPAYISYRQNKIALFTLRLEAIGRLENLFMHMGAFFNSDTPFPEEDTVYQIAAHFIIRTKLNTEHHDSSKLDKKEILNSILQASTLDIQYTSKLSLLFDLSSFANDFLVGFLGAYSDFVGYATAYISDKKPEKSTQEIAIRMGNFLDPKKKSKFFNELNWKAKIQ